MAINDVCWNYEINDLKIFLVDCKGTKADTWQSITVLWDFGDDDNDEGIGGQKNDAAEI